MLGKFIFLQFGFIVFFVIIIIVITSITIIIIIKPLVLLSVGSGAVAANAPTVQRMAVRHKVN